MTPLRDYFEGLLNKANKSNTANKNDIFRSELDAKQWDENFYIEGDTVVVINKRNWNVPNLLPVLELMMKLDMKTIKFDQSKSKFRYILSSLGGGEHFIEGIIFELDGAILQPGMGTSIHWKNCTFKCQSVGAYGNDTFENCRFIEGTVIRPKGEDERMLPLVKKCKMDFPIYWSLLSNKRFLTTLKGKSKQSQDIRKEVFDRLGPCILRVMNNNAVLILIPKGMSYKSKLPEVMLPDDYTYIYEKL